MSFALLKEFFLALDRVRQYGTRMHCANGRKFDAAPRKVDRALAVVVIDERGHSIVVDVNSGHRVLPVTFSSSSPL